MSHLIYYGQNREDIVLSAFFKDVKKGFYVDVGACEPIKFSITKLFYERGWNGINIEPQEREYKKLVADRKRDVNLNIGVGEKTGKLKFRVYNNEALSTFSEDVKQKYQHTKDQTGLGYKDKTVEIKTLRDIFAEHKVKSIQFLKVDVEGFEYEVLKGNDWDKYRPEVLCIEANNMVKAQPWQSLLEKINYTKVFFDGLNEYYVSKEAAAKEQQFREEYQRLIVAVPALSFDWDITMGKTVRQLERVQKSLDHHVALNRNLQAQLAKTSKQMNSPKFLMRRLARVTAKKILK